MRSNIITFLLVITSCKAIEERIRISFQPGQNKTLCFKSINFTNCSHPAVKVRYIPQPQNKSSVLLLNKKFDPSRVLHQLEDYGKFGFKNVTVSENLTDVCITFSQLFLSADRKQFELEQICGVDKLERETKHFLTFYKGNISSDISSKPPKTTGSTPSETTPTSSGRSGSSGLSGGAIAGIVSGVVVILIFVCVLVYFKVWRYCKKTDGNDNHLRNYQNQSELTEN